MRCLLALGVLLLLPATAGGFTFRDKPKACDDDRSSYEVDRFVRMLSQDDGWEGFKGLKSAGDEGLELIAGWYMRTRGSLAQDKDEKVALHLLRCGREEHHALVGWIFGPENDSDSFLLRVLESMEPHLPRFDATELEFLVARSANPEVRRAVLAPLIGYHARQGFNPFFIYAPITKKTVAAEDAPSEALRSALTAILRIAATSGDPGEPAASRNQAAKYIGAVFKAGEEGASAWCELAVPWLRGSGHYQAAATRIAMGLAYGRAECSVEGLKVISEVATKETTQEFTDGLLDSLKDFGCYEGAAFLIDMLSKQTRFPHEAWRAKQMRHRCR